MDPWHFSAKTNHPSFDSNSLTLVGKQLLDHCPHPHLSSWEKLYLVWPTAADIPRLEKEPFLQLVQLTLSSVKQQKQIIWSLWLGALQYLNSSLNIHHLKCQSPKSQMISNMWQLNHSLVQSSLNELSARAVQISLYSLLLKKLIPIRGSIIYKFSVKDTHVRLPLDYCTQEHHLLP